MGRLWTTVWGGRHLVYSSIRISTPGTYPVLIAVVLRSSEVVRAFGGKQVADRGPYLLQAATPVHVNLGQVVQIYNTAEALP